MESEQDHSSTHLFQEKIDPDYTVAKDTQTRFLIYRGGIPTPKQFHLGHHNLTEKGEKARAELERIYSAIPLTKDGRNQTLRFLHRRRLEKIGFVNGTNGDFKDQAAIYLCFQRDEEVAYLQFKQEMTILESRGNITSFSEVPVPVRTSAGLPVATQTDIDQYQVDLDKIRSAIPLTRDGRRQTICYTLRLEMESLGISGELYSGSIDDTELTMNTGETGYIGLECEDEAVYLAFKRDMALLKSRKVTEVIPDRPTPTTTQPIPSQPNQESQSGNTEIPGASMEPASLNGVTISPPSVMECVDGNDDTEEFASKSAARPNAPTIPDAASIVGGDNDNLSYKGKTGSNNPVPTATREGQTLYLIYKGGIPTPKQFHLGQHDVTDKGEKTRAELERIYSAIPLTKDGRNQTLRFLHRKRLEQIGFVNGTEAVDYMEPTSADLDNQAAIYLRFQRDEEVAYLKFKKEMTMLEFRGNITSFSEVSVPVSTCTPVPVATQTEVGQYKAGLDRIRSAIPLTRDGRRQTVCYTLRLELESLGISGEWYNGSINDTELNMDTSETGYIGLECEDEDAYIAFKRDMMCLRSRKVAKVVPNQPTQTTQVIPFQANQESQIRNTEVVLLGAPASPRDGIISGTKCIDGYVSFETEEIAVKSAASPKASTIPDVVSIVCGDNDNLRCKEKIGPNNPVPTATREGQTLYLIYRGGIPTPKQFHLGHHDITDKGEKAGAELERIYSAIPLTIDGMNQLLRYLYRRHLEQTTFGFVNGTRAFDYMTPTSADLDNQVTIYLRFQRKKEVVCIQLEKGMAMLEFHETFIRSSRVLVIPVPTSRAVKNATRGKVDQYKVGLESTRSVTSLTRDGRRQAVCCTLRPEMEILGISGEEHDGSINDALTMDTSETEYIGLEYEKEAVFFGFIPDMLLLGSHKAVNIFPDEPTPTAIRQILWKDNGRSKIGNTEAPGAHIMESASLNGITIPPPSVTKWIDDNVSKKKGEIAMNPTANPNAPTIPEIPVGLDREEDVPNPLTKTTRPKYGPYEKPRSNAAFIDGICTSDLPKKDGPHSFLRWARKRISQARRLFICRKGCRPEEE